MNLSSKHVLIAGGAGFIGSALTRYLLNLGSRITVVDDYTRGNRENLHDHLNSIELIEKDLSVETVSMRCVDIVVDLAAQVFGVRHLHRDGGQMLAKNIRTTVNLVEEAAHSGVARYVYVSSSCVYDFPGAVIPHREEDTGNPSSQYGQSKWYGENIVRAFAEQSGMKFAMTRLFNVYGPNESPNSPHVIVDFMRKAHEIRAGRADSFEIIGDGTQTRSFCHVDDIVRGLVLLAADPRAEGQVFNLGAPDAMTIQSLAEKIVAMYEIANVKYEHVTAPSRDITQRAPDISKAVELLGWEPEIGFDQGLQQIRVWIEPLVDRLEWRL